MDTKINIDCARTSGDGMEMEQPDSGKIEVDVSKVECQEESVNTITFREKVLSPRRKTSVNLPIPGLHTLYRRQSVEHLTRSLPPVQPKGKLYLLKPRLVNAPKTPEHKKNRPPRFIPFEPYPGAINPIFATKSNQTKVLKRNKNNLDINVLVTQMSTMKTNELGNVEVGPEVVVSSEQKEMAKMKEEIEKLTKERDYFQSQLKFQVKVNSELKNLLVASVGEDLQTRVNVLTEDKLQLAKALLDTANNLTTHTEQIEFLAGQCEVWRSKFLASSVMIEELARWKADLVYKNGILTESNKKMLHLTSQVREMELDILKNLKFIAKLKTLNLPSSDLLSITAECLNITQQMVLHSGVGMPDNLQFRDNAESRTDAEKYAIQSLETISQQLMSPDEASKAIVGQAQRPYRPVAVAMDRNMATTQINE